MIRQIAIGVLFAWVIFIFFSVLVVCARDFPRTTFATLVTLGGVLWGLCQ